MREWNPLKWEEAPRLTALIKIRKRRAIMMEIIRVVKPFGWIGPVLKFLLSLLFRQSSHCFGSNEIFPDFEKETRRWKKKKQGPVSTMQKTGWTNYSSFLVWKRVSPMDVIAKGHSTTSFLCIWPFSARWHPYKRRNDQTTGWFQCKPALDEWEGSLLGKNFSQFLKTYLIWIMPI